MRNTGKNRCNVAKDGTFPTAGPPSSLGLQNEGTQCNVADAESGIESSLCL